MGEDRAPQWPHGIVGSITHGAGWAGVVVARQSEWRGLGLDIERVLVCERADRLAGEISRPANWRRLHRWATTNAPSWSPAPSRSRKACSRPSTRWSSNASTFRMPRCWRPHRGSRACACLSTFRRPAQRRIGRRPVRLFRRLPAEPGQYPHRAFARLKRRWPANGRPSPTDVEAPRLAGPSC